MPYYPEIQFPKYQPIIGNAIAMYRQGEKDTRDEERLALEEARNARAELIGGQKSALEIAKYKLDKDKADREARDAFEQRQIDAGIASGRPQFEVEQYGTGQKKIVDRNEALALYRVRFPEKAAALAKMEATQKQEGSQLEALASALPRVQEGDWQGAQRRLIGGGWDVAKARGMAPEPPKPDRVVLPGIGWVEMGREPGAVPRTVIGVPADDWKFDSARGAFYRTGANGALEWQAPEGLPEKRPDATSEPRGGVIEWAVRQIMKDNPNLTATQAIQMAQTGFRQGITLDENGNAAPIPGMPGARGQNAYGEKAGEKRAESDYAAAIEANKGLGQAAAKGAENLPKEQRAMAAKALQMNAVTQAIDTAEKQANGWTTGFMGSLTRGVKGTPSYDLAQTVETIKARVGFDTLQEMRAASPTGGALGPVSDRENVLLQSAIANLETAQSKEQFLRNLGILKAQFTASMEALGKAYDQDKVRFGPEALRKIAPFFGDGAGAAPPPPGIGVPAAPKPGATWEDLKRRQGVR